MLTTNSSSRYFETAIWSPRPFLRRVFNTKSRARACPDAGSNGRSLMLVSVGSPVSIPSERIQEGDTRPREYPNTWHDRPMVENLQAECLALCCRSQICLEPIGVNDGNECLHRIQRGPGFRNILCDMPTSTSEDGVHCRYTIRGSLDFHVVYRFH